MSGLRARQEGVALAPSPSKRLLLFSSFKVTVGDDAVTHPNYFEGRDFKKFNIVLAALYLYPVGPVLSGGTYVLQKTQ